MAGADSNFESFAGLYGADAAPREHTPVEEALVGLIGKLDEPKSLLWPEPFDDCAKLKGRTVPRTGSGRTEAECQKHEIVDGEYQCRTRDAANGGNLARFLKLRSYEDVPDRL